MPTYDYTCNACNHRFEAVQKITDSPLTECPACHQSALRKLLSASGFVLKGSGWHRNSFKDSKYKDKEEDSMPTCGTGACPSCALD
jgi:putative FmdB family regulatory protein